MIFDSQNLTETLYARLTEYEIFSFSLDIPATKIVNLVEYNKRFKIHMVGSATPSCVFTFSKRHSGKSYLYLKCFANDRYSGDCLHYAAIKLKKNININTDFVYVVKYLIAHWEELKQEPIHATHIQIDRPNYVYNLRDFTYLDYNYFNKFDIDPLLAKIHYRCIADIYDIDTNKYVYRYRPHDAAYIFPTAPFITDEATPMKIYFPYRKSNKFKVLHGSVIFEDTDLYNPNNKGKILIITKSHKDKIVLRKYLQKLHIYDIYVTNVSSESMKYDEEISLLYAHYSQIYTMYDMDITGVLFSIHYRRLGIPTLLPNHGFYFKEIPHKLRHIKDFSDLVELDKDTAMEILYEITNLIYATKHKL